MSPEADVMELRRDRGRRSFVAAASAVVILLSGLGSTTAGASSNAERGGTDLPASTTYVADFVSTAATGAAMNDAGDVTGTSYPDPGCGPFCLPTQETVVWRGGVRIVLPSIPGYTGITVRSINDEGWVAGFAGMPGLTTRAVVWKPNGDSYQAIDLGTLPGTSISEAVGIDDLGRVVGWSTTSGVPPNGSPFMWTESGGMIDLSSQGFPDEPILALSPGGTVATQNAWYRLGDPGSVQTMSPAPPGFVIGAEPTAINDAGDQARFLISTGTENLRYLHRFHHEGTWQQISSTGIKHSAYGVGSIDAAQDVTATVAGVGVIAYGPTGVTQPLADLLSPAYGDRVVTVGGPINASGQILAQVMVGRAVRLMRLSPATPCTASCIRVATLLVRARFIEDPQDPGHCTPDGNAFNKTSVRLTITSETGARLKGVLISGRFLDDYWTNHAVTGTTTARGTVSFAFTGPCGVGAVAFLVDAATKGTRTFDRTMGEVAGWAIPQM